MASSEPDSELGSRGKVSILGNGLALASGAAEESNARPVPDLGSANQASLGGHLA